MLRLEALDPLFFRDGKPFTMAEDSGAEGLFPPPPSVFYGALQRLYFMRPKDELSDQNADPTMRLKVKGVYIEVDGEIYVPVPYDCVEIEEAENTVTRLRLEPNPHLRTSSARLPMMLRAANAGRIKQVDAAWMKVQDLSDYLTGKQKTFSYRHISDFVVSERKIGIGRNPDTQTVQEGLLYGLTMTRLESAMREDGTSSKLSLLVDYDGLDFLDEGVVRLGGEARLASYTKVATKLPDLLTSTTPVLDNRSATGKRFKLYLATPAMFRRGWLPHGIDPRTLEGEWRGIHLRLLTVALGKYVPIGGFTMREHPYDDSGTKKWELPFDETGAVPKVMRRAVPAGSVYYFELLDTKQDMEAVYEAFHGRNISDWNYDHGMGLSFVGGVE